MAHPLSTIYLGLVALFFIASGAYALSAPLQFAAALDLSTLRNGGVNEARAQYGGFFPLLGAACGLAPFGIVERRFGLGGAALTFGGVIARRLTRVLPGRGRTRYA